MSQLIRRRSLLVLEITSRPCSSVITSLFSAEARTEDQSEIDIDSKYLAVAVQVGVVRFVECSVFLDYFEPELEFSVIIKWTKIGLILCNYGGVWLYVVNVTLLRLNSVQMA